MGVPELPLIVLPHPVGDLSPEELEKMARLAYPSIVTALTQPGRDRIDYFVDYVRPGSPAPAQDAECEVCVE